MISHMSSSFALLVRAFAVAGVLLLFTATEAIAAEKRAESTQAGDQLTYRARIEAYDAEGRTLTCRFLESAQIEPGMFIDAGTLIRFDLTKPIAHNPKAFHVGGVVIVVNAFQDGHWKAIAIKPGK